MNIRVIYNYILVRLGLRQVLPIDYVRRVKVQECGEPLVALKTKQTIFYDEELSLVARKSVVEKRTHC